MHSYTFEMDGGTLASVIRSGMIAQLGDDELQGAPLLPPVPQPASSSQLAEMMPPTVPAATTSLHVLDVYVDAKGGDEEEVETDMGHGNDDNLEVDTSFEVEEVSTIEERHGEVVEEVELHDEDKSTCAIGYVQDPSSRRKRLSARKKTLLEKAKELSTMCGCQVDLDIWTESGKEYSYHSHPVTRRSVKLQAGKTMLETRASPRPSHHTPTKRRATQTTPKSLRNVAGPSTTTSAPVQGLPGKKKKEMTRRARESPAQNKCKVCQVMFDSKKDKDLQKKKGASASWLGCDIEECNYWGHACCIGIQVRDRRSAKSIPFKCKDHQ